MDQWIGRDGLHKKWTYLEKKGQMRPSVVRVCCVLAVLSLAVLEGSSQPVKFQKWENFVEAMGRELTQGEDECRNGGEIRNLCEKCAKVTRNEVAFPLCCQDQKAVRSWCKKYLSYTYKP